VRTTARPSAYDVKITNYAWDQSDKFVKIYITLKNVHTIPPENVKSTFTSRSLQFVVRELDGRNHTLTLPNLMGDINTESSYNKVKQDAVTIFMKKEGSKQWSHLTTVEQKAKEPRVPKPDDSGEPGDGLMTMMKQMYEDGDDDMKRTIAKAWTESREKGGKGLDL
jgi:calcyclin binding protein